MKQRLLTTLTPVLLLLALGLVQTLSCRSIYYNAWEQFGREKRHILTKRVEATREEQSEAQEQFQTAFERFKSVTQFEGGDLEKMYRKLSDELARSEVKAEKVSERVDSVDVVARDLFKEWETELDQMSSPDLRQRSAERLTRTRSRYRTMIRAMRRAESKMEPVLQAFRDQVLFLKHNLNAKAISSLEGTVSTVEEEVETLIEELNLAIAEADSFLSALKT